jgi:hypothetical protein
VLFLRLAVQLVVEAFVEVQRFVVRAGPQVQEPAAFGVGHHVGGAVHYQQRQAQGLGMGLDLFGCAKDFGAGAHGKTAVKDQRITLELCDDRRIAGDEAAAHAHESQPGQQSADAPGQVAEDGKHPAADAQGRGAEDHSGERGLAGDGQQGDDRPAHAVPEQKQRLARLAGADAGEEYVQVGEVLVEGADHGPLAR